MQYSKRATFSERMLAYTAPGKTRFIADAVSSISLSNLAAGRMRKPTIGYAGQNVMVRTQGQLATVLAVLALDGVAGRILLCPADVVDMHIPQLMRDGEAELTVTDADIKMEINNSFGGDNAAIPFIDTEWVLFTSGTTGLPKLVQHSFASLTAPLCDGLVTEHPVWSTFYDIRRYGGLQILLRALIGRGSMVLSAADEPVSAFISRLANMSVTHISGTPSHWRRVLMSGMAGKMAPNYVRLSGEMAGQDIINWLGSAYPGAKIGHVYASTEAGVAFSVDDRQAGFPVSILNAPPSCPDIKIVNGTLHVRSSALASRYLSEPPHALVNADGFVDTGDMVEQRAERFVFVGRREGVVNVGGLKVYPEEVEASINLHPAVAMSRVWGRPSPIMGTLIAADIVLKPKSDGTKHNLADISGEIIASCRSTLAPHKVPVRLTEVSDIPIMESGKIKRSHA